MNKRALLKSVIAGLSFALTALIALTGCQEQRTQNARNKLDQNFNIPEMSQDQQAGDANSEVVDDQPASDEAEMASPAPTSTPN